MATRYNFSHKERLEVYYIELHTLEMQLDSQLATERATKRTTLKPSRATKYKISVLMRAIRKLEQLINAQAIRYQDWEYANQDIQRELDRKEEERLELLESINLLEAEIRNSNGTMNTPQVLLKGTEFTVLSVRAENLRDDIKDLRLALMANDKKKPAYAKLVSKESFINNMAAENSKGTIALPDTLQALARDIETGKTDIREFNTIGNTDVSMFFTPQPYDSSNDKIPESQLVKESNETLQSETTSVGVDSENTPLDTSDDK